MYLFCVHFICIAIFPSRFFSCEMLRFGIIGWRDICLISNIQKKDCGYVAKTQKQYLFPEGISRLLKTNHRPLVCEQHWLQCIIEKETCNKSCTRGLCSCQDGMWPLTVASMSPNATSQVERKAQKENDPERVLNVIFFCKE